MRIATYALPSLVFPPGVSYRECSMSLPPKDDRLQELRKISTKFYTGASPFPGLFRVLKCGLRAQVLWKVPKGLATDSR